MKTTYKSPSGGISSNWKQLKKSTNIGSSKGVAKKSIKDAKKNVVEKTQKMMSSSKIQRKEKEPKEDDKPLNTSNEVSETTPADEASADSVKEKKSQLQILQDILSAADSNLDEAAPAPEHPVTNLSTSSSLFPSETMGNEKIGKYVAMDCEMVGVGSDGTRSMLARVTIVNYWGHVIMDDFVKPMERVTDYRTWITGITASMLKNAIPFPAVQKKVADIIKNRIVVGHGLINDFKVLLLSHPASMVRDTALYAPLRNQKTKKPRALRHLTKEILGIDIQTGAHSSVEDARSVMLLYQKHKTKWEAQIAKMRRTKTRN